MFFSAAFTWQVSPISIAISNFSSAPQRAGSTYNSPQGPFLSELLDCVRLIRFSKPKCFELLTSFNGKGFESALRIGESFEIGFVPDARRSMKNFIPGATVFMPGVLMAGKLLESIHQFWFDARLITIFLRKVQQRERQIVSVRPD